MEENRKAEPLPVISIIHKYFMVRYAKSLCYDLVEETPTRQRLYLSGMTANGQKGPSFLALTEFNGCVIVSPNGPNGTTNMHHWEAVAKESKQPLVKINYAFVIKIDLVCPKSFGILQKVIKTAHKTYRRRMKCKGTKIARLQYC